jgi:Asp-tRNA(Asn)/Glu-tRNA(Gln) amidotransferase C subunit
VSEETFLKHLKKACAKTSRIEHADGGGKTPSTTPLAFDRVKREVCEKPGRTRRPLFSSAPESRRRFR